MNRGLPLAATLALCACLFGCPAKPPAQPMPPSADETALRIRVAAAEARRADGVAELTDLALHGTRRERLLALRGLGRIGGAPVVATLREVFLAGEPELAATAAAALGVAASLDDESYLTAADVKRLPTSPTEAALVMEGLGRAGDASTQDTLATALGGPPPIAAAAGFALGRHGRRKIATGATAEAALVQACAHADASVRYAAVQGLAREFQPPDNAAAGDALAARIADTEPEVRAQAIAALTRRKQVARGRPQIVEALRDRDWRVAVEAVRALTGGEADDASRDAVAAILARRLVELEKGSAGEAHVIMEGLRGLADAAGHQLVRDALAALATAIKTAQVPDLTRGWIACLIVAAQSREHPAAIGTCSDALPEHLRLGLVGDAIAAGKGSLDERQRALADLLGHRDSRVRAAGIAALPKLWKEQSEVDRRAAMGTIVSALGAKDPIVAGSAVDAATELYEAVGTGDHDALDAALVARAATEADPELAASLLELVGKRAIARGVAACRAGLAGHPVRAHAAAKCLLALGQPEPAKLAPAQPPPVALPDVIGKRLRWHVTTTRGEIVIRLAPDVAPWAVATIVTLTGKGFYDGLAFHRVVPDFVVQGGDPTQSGWGGPGFTTPAEPATGADGRGYIAGGVGIADAGRDSGGSQWFIMHSAAPHLDGRYTWIGSVESGQAAADALLIGDKVVKATIEIQ
jgi:cyclophilin family peptidyl-prolyl cis-trans isomerase